MGEFPGEMEGEGEFWLIFLVMLHNDPNGRKSVKKVIFQFFGEKYGYVIFNAARFDHADDGTSGPRNNDC